MKDLRGKIIQNHLQGNPKLRLKVHVPGSAQNKSKPIKSKQWLNAIHKNTYIVSNIQTQYSNSNSKPKLVFKQSISTKLKN